ncbi:MAG: M48 family metalloprotease [Planctomycetota bacterium]
MFELIRANKRKSAVLIVVMSAVLVVLGFAVGAAWIGGRAGGVFGAVVAAIVAVVLSLIAYYKGDKAMLAVSRARQIEKKDNPQLFNVVEEMAIASGQPMPKVYIIDDTALNAFATGRKPENAAVAITSGLLAKLNRDELQGVIAHEMSHVKNRDILFMTLAGVLMGSIVLVADIYLRSLWFTGGRRRRRSSREGGGAQAIFAILAILLAILAPLVARLLYLACSRRREYLADASAAVMTRYPEGLASALEKISGDREVLESANRATAPMYIVHPIKAFEKRAAKLSSTHPPTEERIAILRSLGKSASFADYERAYEARHRGERMVPRSALADDQPVATRPPSEEPTPQQSPADRLRRAHDALDTVRRVQGFLFLTCACGARLKIPPGFSRPQLRCPRCGTAHKTADAKPAEEG